MKKTVSLALALTLALSLAACGSGGSSSSTPADASGSSSQSDTSSSAAGSVSTPEVVDDVATVTEKGTLVVGITNFAPMDYQDENGEWIGFDADMAKQFAEYLGVDVEFSEINWDYKVMELNAGNIDVVWNGMTILPEVTSTMDVSIPYCLNAQVLVVPVDKVADFEDLTSLEGLTVAVESGSAGEAAATALGASTVAVAKQADTLLEVSAGTSDAAVIDLLMAGAMIGEGTNYESLTYVLNLNELQNQESEEYGVGFRQGSNLVDEFNTFWAEKVADGTVLEVATTYGLQESVILE